MPPKIRFSKADILHAAFKMTREQGIASVNARAIAKELGCSTQPIFRAFVNMESIKTEIIRMSSELYNIYMMRSATVADKPYLSMGMAYVAFARDEPELYKLLFMCDRTKDGGPNDVQQQLPEYIIDMVMQRTGLEREQARRFHSQIWIYTYGLATMVSTRYIDVTQEQIEQRMEEIYQAMWLVYGLGVSK